MNRTEHGNIAIGAPDSIARLKANEVFLATKLRMMTRAAAELRDSFVPNDENHPAIRAYNEAASYKSTNSQVMRQLIVTITTPEGEIIDRETVEIDYPVQTGAPVINLPPPGDSP